MSNLNVVHVFVSFILDKMDITSTLISFEDFVPTGLRDDYLKGKCQEIELICLDGSQFSDKYENF